MKQLLNNFTGKKMQFEINRKIFHLASLAIPFIYLFLDRIVMTILLMIFTAIILYVDISRHYNAKIKEIVDKYFAKLMRESEVSGSFHLSGMSNFFLGSFLVILLFSKGLAITALMVLILADSAAAIVGMRYGTPIRDGKSMEGSITFASVTFFVSLLGFFFLGFDTSFLVILLATAITTAAEFFAPKLKTDDNLLIPMTYAVSTFILALIF